MPDFGLASADLIVTLLDTCVDAKNPLVSESFRQEALANFALFVSAFNERMLEDMVNNAEKLGLIDVIELP